MLCHYHRRCHCRFRHRHVHRRDIHPPSYAVRPQAPSDPLQSTAGRPMRCPLRNTLGHACITQMSDIKIPKRKEKKKQERGKEKKTTHSSPFLFLSAAFSLCLCSIACFPLVASPYAFALNRLVTSTHNRLLSYACCFFSGRTRFGTTNNVDMSINVPPSTPSNPRAPPPPRRRPLPAASSLPLSAAMMAGDAGVEDVFPEEDTVAVLFLLPLLLLVSFAAPGLGNDDRGRPTGTASGSVPARHQRTRVRHDPSKYATATFEGTCFTFVHASCSCVPSL